MTVQTTTTTAQTTPKPTEAPAQESEPAEEPYYAWTDEECQAIIERVYAWADKKGYRYRRVSDIEYPNGGYWDYSNGEKKWIDVNRNCYYGEVYKNSSWQDNPQNCYYNDGKVEMLYDMDEMMERLCERVEFENEKGHIPCIDYDVMSDYIEWAESQGWDTTYTKLLYPPNSIVFIATW